MWSGLDQKETSSLLISSLIHEGPVKLKGLLLNKEIHLGDDISEFWTVVDPMFLPGGWTAGGRPEVQKVQDMTLLGLAFSNLREMLKEFPSLAVLTNDVSEEEEKPTGGQLCGFLPARVFETHPHVTIQGGVWGKDFEKGPEVRNTLFVLEGGDFTDFLEHYLGGHPGTTQYRFLLGKEEIDLTRARELIESAEDRSSFIASLLKLALVVTYGFELDAYAFFTRDEGLKGEIRGLPKWEGH